MKAGSTKVGEGGRCKDKKGLMNLTYNVMDKNTQNESYRTHKWTIMEHTNKLKYILNHIQHVYMTGLK